MRARTARVLLTLSVFLLCLSGCASNVKPVDPYKGTWYWAKNGVECVFDDGKIYQDDYTANEGQSLGGIYREIEDHIEAHLVGVGGIHIPRELYVVDTADGQILCDSPDGNGTIYFYRDALAALEVVEAKEEAARQEAGKEAEEKTTAPAPTDIPEEDKASDPTPDPGQDLEPEPSPAPGWEAGPVDAGEPAGAPEREATPAPSSATQPPSPLPTEPQEQSMAAISKEDAVWIPKSGKKYHSTPSCSGMKDPTKVTLAEAQSRGYTPCKRCY